MTELVRLIGYEIEYAWYIDRVRRGMLGQQVCLTRIGLAHYCLDATGLPGVLLHPRA